MPEKKELKEEELNKADGGGVVVRILTYKCYSCGYTWNTNKYPRACPDCGSENIKQP